MIAIVDYGVGNLFSLRCSLESMGCNVLVTGKEKELKTADKVILPGVGAFEDAANKLRASGLDGTLKRLAAAGKPLLGICLGMQLLFDASEEFGEHEGLGLIPGRVVSLKQALNKAGYTYKVPHIGWNPLELKQPQNALLKYTQAGDAMYYVHSFYVDTPQEYVLAGSEYGVFVTGAVANANVYGTQFHPEKSGGAGLKLLKAFTEIE